ncbi:phosphonate C-P lyase system protein PhnG [Paraburkholderia aspalathi]|uniref:Alpha-D-ribose 1-methylphosphonate 5-triphosphate synthase subunit PhnG n=1 Tax=Paraburkholderia aspalathi TaxID=1324617 RepID=A0A1I7B8P9_9BURK|nr:phosphonate C-P lyase system protein PhnG [Paraburkholderia aspalathi]SFT83508.1 alpha-D-ribose 1-methylphosphonate 5-triphosphate synthase subunit PhnG [Paraburkholderia aspalathi]
MKEPSPDDALERRRWLAQIAGVPRGTLETALMKVCGGSDLPAFEWLRAPETGLTMVRGRIGGTGNPFNLGETTVTRAVLRLKSPDGASTVGVSYQLGRDKRRAELSALADAMLQSTHWRDATRAQLIEPAKRSSIEERQKRADATASTKVEFYTMVRGEH